jgi:hypothetical protein
MADLRPRYVTTAALLGGVTFCLVPLLSGGFDRDAMNPFPVLGCFVVTSCWVSIQFRRWIRDARGFRLLSTGIVLMYVWAVGCALLIGLVDLAGRALGVHSPERSLIGDPDRPLVPFLIAAPLGALLTASSLFFVTIPMGIASVAILRWAGSPRNAADRAQDTAATSTRAL